MTSKNKLKESEVIKMFWIQDTGNKYNNSAYNLYYADYESDVKNLPTSSKEGLQDGDTVANKRTCNGSECLYKWREIRFCERYYNFFCDE